MGSLAEEEEAGADGEGAGADALLCGMRPGKGFCPEAADGAAPAALVSAEDEEVDAGDASPKPKSCVMKPGFAGGAGGSGGCDGAPPAAAAADAAAPWSAEPVMPDVMLLPTFASPSLVWPPRGGADRDVVCRGTSCPLPLCSEVGASRWRPYDGCDAGTAAV